MLTVLSALDVQAPIFTDAIDSLPPDAFVSHFLTRNTVSHPDLPEPTGENLSNARKVLDNQFDLVGETYVLPDGFSWKTNPSRDKEWQIAHHKFSFAVDLIHAYRHFGDEAYLKTWATLLTSWLDEMGSGYIVLSDAQVEARRIENWVYSFLLLRDMPCRTVLGYPLLRRFLERIASETLYICRNLKPVRNHRTFQLYSVFLVGVLFPEFRRHLYFLRFSRDRLTDNLLTDVLDDGVHVELSTHYHQLVAETFLRFVELAERNGIALDEALRPRLRKALEFSMFLQWPNGEIPLINDSDDGNHLDLLRRGARLFHDGRLLWAATLGRSGRPPRSASRHFGQSGYFVFRDGWGRDPNSYASRQHVFYDCARLGDGSHSHYDLFSFCYYVNGEPAVIDPGRYTYSSDPDPDGIDWRRVFKSTAAHNTVTIDRKDQTRYLSRTRHGPEVEILEKDFHLGEQSDWVSARARSREYSPIHERLFVYMSRQYLFILDYIHIEDGELHECALRFHLSDRLPPVSMREEAGEVSVRSPQVHILSHRPPGLTARIEGGWVSRRYGVKAPAPVATFVRTGRESLFFCSVVAPGPADRKAPQVRRLTRLAPSGRDALLFRADVVSDGKAVSDWYLFETRPVPETIECHGIRFRGRFLALRRNSGGDVVHLFSRQAEEVAIEGGPCLAVSAGRNLECSRS